MNKHSSKIAFTATGVLGLIALIMISVFYMKKKSKIFHEINFTGPLTDTPNISYLGSFDDKKARTFNEKVSTGLKSLAECAAVASKAGSPYFGAQAYFNGAFECWYNQKKPNVFGDSVADNDNNVFTVQDGPEKGMKIGKNWVNAIYKITPCNSSDPSSCPDGYNCVEGNCKKVDPVPDPDIECENNMQCSPGFNCVNNKCINPNPDPGPKPGPTPGPKPSNSGKKRNIIIISVAAILLLLGIPALFLLKQKNINTSYNTPVTPITPNIPSA